MNTGRIVAALTDESRKDPFSNDEVRTIITSVYYPSDDDSQRHAASYVALFEPAKDQATRILKDMEVDIEYLNTVETRIYNHAKQKTTASKANVILYSPGFGVSKDMYSFHIQQLVDSGFIVVAIGSTHESVFSIFPDGRFYKQSDYMSTINSADFDTWKKLLTTRVEDILYVIEHLDLLFSQAKLEALHPYEIGIVGHSLGGAAAIEVAKREKRIRAVVMFDPSFHLIELNEHIDVPVLIMRQEKCTYDELHDELSKELLNPFVNGYERLYHQLIGDKNAVKVKGTHHMTFSDVPIHYNEPGAIEKHTLISEFSTAFLGEYVLNKTSLFHNLMNFNLPSGIVEIDSKGK